MALIQKNMGSATVLVLRMFYKIMKLSPHTFLYEERWGGFRGVAAQIIAE